MVWRFIAHIKDLEEFNDVLADALYERCPDASLFSSCGHAKIGFDREAPSLQAAIRSAVADVTQAGVVVSSIEIIEEDLAELPQ